MGGDLDIFIETVRLSVVSPSSIGVYLPTILGRIKWRPRQRATNLFTYNFLHKFRMELYFIQSLNSFLTNKNCGDFNAREVFLCFLKQDLPIHTLPAISYCNLSPKNSTKFHALDFVPNKILQVTTTELSSGTPQGGVTNVPMP